MTPAMALLGLLAITIVAVVVQIYRRRRKTNDLCRLAHAWEMHYSSSDRFKLSHRLPNPLPQPGAADIRVVDVLFATHHHRHLYLFTIEYSLGALTGVHRFSRAAAVAESVRRGPIHEPSPMQFILAPPHLPLIQQYQSLHEQTRI